MTLEIVLVTSAPIGIPAKDTGSGDYMVSCEGELSTVLVRMFLS